MKVKRTPQQIYSETHSIGRLMCLRGQGLEEVSLRNDKRTRPNKSRTFRLLYTLSERVTSSERWTASVTSWALIV